MASPQDTSRHTCHHCETEVLTFEGGELTDWSRDSDIWQWRLPLKHSPDGVHEAARSGCPFFVRIWEKLHKFCAADKALGGTTLSFELSALMHTPPSVITYESTGDDSPELIRITQSEEMYFDITTCDIIRYTPNRSGEARTHEFVAVSDWDDPSADHAIARMIDGYTSSVQAIDQIRRRLQYCLEHHYHKCEAAFSGIRPRRFLSVGDSIDPTVKVMRAENLSNRDSEPYTALSYCWGQDQEFKLISANQTDMEDGIPLDVIPKTIMDAIYVTRELGLKLLWVDSLCLVQDKEEELAKEIARMHHYYGNAHITISAVAAASCTEGFLQDHPTPRGCGEYPMDDVFYLPVDLGVPERPSYLKLVSQQHGHHQKMINLRGWTLQEGLLSHRLVSFTPRYVSWSCRTESFAMPDDDQRHLYHKLTAVCGPVAELLGYESARLKLGAWWDVIENYTFRSLSDDMDKLPAISGIASVLSAPAADISEPEYQLTFVAGLLVRYPCAHPPSVANSSGPEIKYYPQDHYESWLLAIQLLWQHAYLREDHWKEQHGHKLDRHRRNSEPSVYIAPSWSWASHPGPVGIVPRLLGTEICDEELFVQLSWAVWDHGLRIHEVCLAPISCEAPLGALTGGSLTLDGHIFHPDEEQDRIERVDFDDGRRSITPRDCRGLFCLQVVPLYQRAKIMGDRLSFASHDLMYGLHGIVLESVEPDGRCRSDERVYRRVGIYWGRDPSHPDFDAIYSRKLSGTVERIKIV